MEINYRLERSFYKTWIVWKYLGPTRDARVYETTNRTKAQGVVEYLVREAKKEA